MSDPPPIPPLPAQPLSYGNPYDRAGRPGIVTAMGVISIVVASISILAGIIGALLASSFLRMAMFTYTPPVPVAPAANVSVSGGLIVLPEEDGIAAAATGEIVEAMSRRRSLSDQQQTQLNALLTQAGKRIFPVAGDTTITAQFVRGNITASGEIPGVGTRSGSSWFVTGGGRIEVYDDHAVFRPTGSSDIVSVAAPPATTTTGVTMGQQTVTVGPRGMIITPPTTAPTTFPAMRTPRMSRLPPGVVLVATGFGELLAILLLISGILVLRDSRSGGKLHWIYLAVKLPLILISAVAWIWLFQSLMGAFAPGGGGPRLGTMMGMAIWPLMFGAVAAIYPIGLIFVLLSRTVRDYYSPVIE